MMTTCFTAIFPQFLISLIMLHFYFTVSKLVFILFLIFNENSIVCSMKTTSSSNTNVASNISFIDVLKSLDIIDKYPEIMKNGSCFYIDKISVITNHSSKFSIIITISTNSTNETNQKICPINNYRQSQSIKQSNNGTKQDVENGKNHASILAISQTIGIIICALLLGIFFFVAGVMRLKNFIRRNNNVFKLTGLRSCLTNVDETEKWRSSTPQSNINQSTISNYLQLQSVLDKNVGQFMVRSSQYSKPPEQENKKNNASIKRKLSLKNKLLPKRLNNSQNSQRRYSLTNEIESVMNKHFNNIGVTRKYGSKSTQNIGGALMPPINRMSHHSMLNELNFNCIHKNGNVNNVNDSSSMSAKSLLGRHQRYGNFPGRRATTIGGRSNNSRNKSSMRFNEKDSPPGNTMYSSQNSVTVPQSSKRTHVLRKQFTLQEGKESRMYDYSLTNSKLYDNISNKAFDKTDVEACYLKVPFKSLNLLPNKKCIFHINDEKTSPSPESRESNSRCSSFDKASSTWSSLEVQEDTERKNNV